MKRIQSIFFAFAAAVLLCAAFSFTAMAAVGGFRANVRAYYPDSGWSDFAGDNMPQSRSGAYPTALSMTLTGQPEGTTGTIQYQLRMTGGAWGPLTENGVASGNQDGSGSIEAVKICFNGTINSSYDIYYKVFESGAWSDWKKNGEVAGTEGRGTHIDGICVSVVEKGAEAPAGAATGTVDPTRPMVALTFDDGPSSALTPALLSCLEAHGARATFFVLGSKAAANAPILQRMVADGCEIGGHTWNHETITKLSAGDLTNVLNRTNDAVQAACGVRPVIMRPPGGGYNSASLATVGSLGMSAYYWTIDTRDWEHKNAARTINEVLSKVQDGDIILMHDIHSPTIEAAATIIPELINRGFQLVTISEMAACRGGAQPGNIYVKFRP